MQESFDVLLNLACWILKNGLWICEWISGVSFDFVYLSSSVE